MVLSREDFDRMRATMVRRQIAGRGIRDELVLAAMEAVPRHLFVPYELRAHAYEDTPLPIGDRQTISQPYIVAAMIEALQLDRRARVLEIGTGSGYAAAILGEIADEVYTVERFPDLADEAQRAIDAAGFRNVHIRVGDGTLGWPDRAPYDAILVDAVGPVVPNSLKAQLAIGGRLVMPLEGSKKRQELVRVIRDLARDYHIEPLMEVRFVPLIGAEGFAGEADDRNA